ncbi:MAG TPA: hypothetical protein VIJ82_16435 [Streptosporangiaceae bacterium]|jgi:hypothetical protein
MHNWQDDEVGPMLASRSQEEILAAMTPNLQRSIDGDLSPE